jgi:hypothetical protein
LINNGARLLPVPPHLAPINPKSEANSKGKENPKV